MKPKCAVISGITGMTGSETARQLLDKGYFVAGFDNLFASSTMSISDLLERNDFQFFQYDLNSNSDMTLFKDYLIKRFPHPGQISFINCAAVVHTKYFYRPESTFDTNVNGMKNFLKMACELGGGTFINCSSSEVYSLRSFKKGGVRETDPVLIATGETSLRTSYATGKLQTEFFMREAVENHRIKGCSIRFANVYSDREEYTEHIIPYTIGSFLKSPRIVLLENAKRTRRTFLHNYDSARSVVALLECERALDGSIYNVGTNEEIAIVKLVKWIAEKMGVTKPDIIYSGTRSADPPRRLLDTEKLTGQTGWRPVISLDGGLNMCIEKMRRFFKR